jgi:hypothetical protein
LSDLWPGVGSNCESLHYESIGEKEVTARFFLTEHTHTTEAGAKLNASSVAEGIKSLKGCKLKKYLK